MILELSKRLFSDFVSFFACTLYSQISSDFNISYFIFICVGQNLYFHRLLWVDEVVVFVPFLDYTHFQTNTCV
jgi:late competence protein required for DNA uptake (superfamily II DNA/RNA helicase)